MKHNKNEYLIIRIGLSPLSKDTSTMEIAKIMEVDENRKTYNILFGDGSTISIEERTLIGNSYKLALIPQHYYKHNFLST